MGQRWASPRPAVPTGADDRSGPSRAPCPGQGCFDCRLRQAHWPGTWGRVGTLSRLKTLVTAICTTSTASASGSK